MTIITLMVLLILLALALAFIPMEATIRKLIIGIAVVGVVIWALPRLIAFINQIN